MKRITVYIDGVKTGSLNLEGSWAMLWEMAFRALDPFYAPEAQAN